MSYRVDIPTLSANEVYTLTFEYEGTETIQLIVGDLTLETTDRRVVFTTTSPVNYIESNVNLTNLNIYEGYYESDDFGGEYTQESIIEGMSLINLCEINFIGDTGSWKYQMTGYDEEGYMHIIPRLSGYSNYYKVYPKTSPWSTKYGTYTLVIDFTSTFPDKTVDTCWEGSSNTGNSKQKYKDFTYNGGQSRKFVVTFITSETQNYYMELNLGDLNLTTNTSGEVLVSYMIVEGDYFDEFCKEEKTKSWVGIGCVKSPKIVSRNEDGTEESIITTPDDLELYELNGIFDKLDLTNGIVTKYIGNNNGSLYLLDAPTTEQLSLNPLKSYRNGSIQTSSQQLAPTLKTTLPISNKFTTTNLSSGQTYNIYFDGTATKLDAGGTIITNPVSPCKVKCGGTTLTIEGTDIQNVRVLETTVKNEVGNNGTSDVELSSIENLDVNGENIIISKLEQPIKLRSLGTTYDSYNPVTGELTKRIGVSETDGSYSVLSSPITSQVEIDNIPRVYKDGIIKIYSDSNIYPMMTLEIPTTNKYDTSTWETGVYTQRNIVEIYFNDSTTPMIPTETLTLTENQLLSGHMIIIGENPMLIKGNYTGKDIPHFTGMRSVEAIEVKTSNSDSSIQSTIQLPPHIQLHSLPDGIRDEVDIKTGILTRNVGYVVLDGSEEWVATEHRFELKDNFNFKTDNWTRIISDRYNSYDMLDISNQYDSYVIGNGWSSTLFVRDVELFPTPETQINEFKEYLSNKPIKCEYVPTQSTTEQLILNYNNSCDYGRILPTGMCDKYDVVNSMYTQTMTSILLDGANTWDAMEEFENTVKFTATGTTVGVEELNMLGAGGLYCDNDLFPNINDDSDVEHCRVDEAGNKFYIYINKDRLMSPDLIGYQIWLQANPFNMIYELVEHLTYTKPYEELNATQARWEMMDCMRDGAIKYHTNSSDNITIYPTLEYVAPSINNFEVSMLEPNTDYTIYAEGINTNDTINLGGNDINFNNGTVVTSGDNQWLRIDNNDSFYNMVIAKGDTTEEVVPYFKGMTSVKNPKVQCGESTVSYTNLKLRSLPNGVKDTINVVTGEYIQRVGEREYQEGDLTNANVLTDGINTMYELENYIITKLDAQTLLAYKDGTINLSSDTGLLPTTHYTVPSTNTFHLSSMKTGTRYTLKYPSASGSIAIGDITYKISSDSMLFTTPLKINGDTSAIIFSDANPENVVLLEGAYNKREVPFFTGVKSVKNPNITIIDQLSTESTIYNCATEIELRGLPNGVADKLDIIKGKLTTNVGIRPYQEGDENLPNIWTDGYETVYALSSPVVTNVNIDHLTVTTNSLIELSSDYLIPQLNYRAPSSNNFPLDLLQSNQTYTLYADTLTSGSYTLGGTKTGVYSQPHTITLGDTTDNLLTFNGDLGLSNVMLVKGNSLKTTLPPYFLGIRSVTDGHLLVEGMAGEMNEITFDEDIALRDCNGIKDAIDLITCTLTKRTGEITLTGAEGWSILPNTTINDELQVFALTLSGINSSINNGLVCDKFIHKHMSGKLQDTEAIYSTNNQLILVVKKSRIGGDTVNALKSWLNQNHTTVVYPLITQFEIPLENVWTTTPPTSYDNQTEISSTVSSNSLKPMISVTIATTTLEEIVSNLEAQNEKLENESVATMLALTNIYETFAMPMATNETSTIDLSDGKDGNKVNGMSISPIGMIYVNLIKKGYKTIEQTPANLQAEVKYALKGIE